jgi:acid stress-induced BolA-like protein IbaG/YrbA
MTSEEIQTHHCQSLACELCEVEGDGRHWYATMVSSAFEGLRAITRHQRVYATLGPANEDRRGTRLVDEGLYARRMGRSQRLTRTDQREKWTNY